jgi:hypothetical protein
VRVSGHGDQACTCPRSASRSVRRARRTEALHDLEYWRLSLIKWSRAVFVIGFPISLAIVIPQFVSDDRH